MSSFIINNAVIVGEDFFLPNGALFIKEGNIAEVGEKIAHLDVDVIDAGGRVLLPGLVNAHHHLYSSFAPGITPHGVPGTFTQILENLWWALDDVLDEESVFYSALAGVLDSVAHGCTTIFDHHASMSFVSGSLETVKKAFEKVGARGVLCFETSERSGREKIHSHIEENISFYEKNQNNPFCSGMFGLHANMTLSDETLYTIKNAMPEDMPIHVHCGESLEDFAFCVNRGYAGAVDRLDRFGLISKNSILAHCVHVSARDVEIINAKNPIVVTNPESNANNAVGKFNRALLPQHVLGTDGMSGDMIAAMRSYCLLGSREALDSVEKLKIGAAADICVLDYIPLAPVSEQNLLGHILFGAKGGKSWLTMVDGKILWHAGKFQNGIDIEKISQEAKRTAKKLHERFYARGKYQCATS